MAVLTGLAMTGKGQVTSYVFNQEVQPFKDIRDYPSIVVTTHRIQDDFIQPGKQALPFGFRLGGRLMDSVGIHENGYLYFGNVHQFSLSTWPISTVHTAAITGIISALGIDLYPVRSAPRNTTIETGIAGTAPDRVFIAQWSHTSRAEAVTDPGGADDLTFQVRMYEQNNRIEIHYGNFVLNNNVSDAAETGLKGDTYGDYHNRVPAIANWTMTERGTDQLSRAALNSVSSPQNGTLYVWRPGTGTTSAGVLSPSAPSLTVYPVPAGDVLHVRFDNKKEDNYTCIITDLSGKHIRTAKPINNTIDIRTLTACNYLLLLQTKDNQQRALFSKR